MGYTTEFVGEWRLNKQLTPEHKAYLKQFCHTRRVQRDAAKTAQRQDPIREAVGLPVGVEGGYFVGEGGYAGQSHGSDIINGNGPPQGQPGLWCKWEPNEDGTAIEWSGAEKFYDYIKWLQYLIDHFLGPWGYILSGKVTWQGEEDDDIGFIVVSNNKVYVNEEPTVLDKIVEATTASDEKGQS